MFGPAGTDGSAGGAPRPDGTSSHTSVTLSRSQSHGSPVVALMRSAPETIAFADPLVASAIQSSIPVSLVCRNDRRDPSGENFKCDTRACGGMVTFTSA